MKKIKNLDYLLSLGVLILLIAGISLMSTDMFDSPVLKFSGLLFLSAIFYVLSFVYKKILNVPFSNKVSFAFGCFTLALAHIVAGFDELFGHWFSVYGDGAAIFYMSLAFLIAMLSILTIVLYKNYRFVHLTYVAIIMMFYNLFAYFTFNIQSLFICSTAILLILNVLKVNDRIYKFTNVAILVNAIVTMVYVSDVVLIPSIILDVINIFACLYVLNNHNHKSEYEIVAYIILFAFQVLLLDIVADTLNNNLTLVISTAIVCSIDLIISTFRLLSKDFIKITHKIVTAIMLISIMHNPFFVANYQYLFFDAKAHLVAVIFILFSSIACSYGLHNKDYEEYFFPFKLFFLIFYVSSLFGQTVLSSLYGLLAVIVIFISRKMSANGLRKFYLICGLVYCAAMLSTLESNLIDIVFASVTLSLMYLLLKSDRSEDSLLYLVYTVFMLGLLELGTITFVELLIMIIIGGLMSYINRNNKFNFVVSIGYLLIVLNSFFFQIFEDYNMYVIMFSFMYFLITSICAEIVFARDRSKSIFVGIAFALGFLRLFQTYHSFLILLYILIASLVMILVSLKNNGYKSLYHVGIAAAIIDLLALLSFLENVPTAVYLFIIAVIVITVVTVMIYKFQKREEEKNKTQI